MGLEILTTLFLGASYIGILLVQLGVNTQTIKQPRLYPYMST